DQIGAIVIATTRPETMFGDVAIAVNPKDYKYKELIGKTVVIPLSGKEIPIIADEYVDMEFGTGALKITPAHDPNDYEVGKRHNLSPVWIMDKKGCMSDNENVPYEIRGLDRYEARKKTVKMLDTSGQLIRVLPHEHNVGHCQRCNTTIEPYLSEQWFVKMKPLSEKPIKAVEIGELNFIPDRWTKIYLDWMENIRDWCISRQLWWGHRIPAYYCNNCKKMIVSIDEPKKCTECDHTEFTQDNDVLDTWFSSGLWPFSTMGWPDKESKDFKKYYPTNTLVTGFDIIFFWVARMVTMGYEFTNQSPFKNVYIHGLIRDEQGQKMSKSRGNTIDPVTIIDKYGSDALRFTLTNLVTFGGQDIKVSDERFEYGRNFANKIWNASRFVLMNLDGVDENEIDIQNLTIADKWILHKLNETSKEINENIKNFRIGETAHILYDFFRNTYCDWYVEIAKIQLRNENQKLNTQRVLRYVLERTLRLLHPIMPHITEKIWQLIPFDTYKDAQKSIMSAKFPIYDEKFVNKEAENQMNLVIDTVRSIRNIRQSLNIPVSSFVNLQINPSNIEKKVFENTLSYIEAIARVQKTEIKDSITAQIQQQSATAVVGNSKIIIPLAGLIDIDKELQRQNKKLETLEKEREGLEVRLNNGRFLESAPKEVIVQSKERIKEINIQLNAIKDLVGSLI
ncbi:MAG: valine--tRNA ligase, partial [Candidatus Gastranaerophilales bacterium]|nr:valine--tRNA ligase [Candidatus Gastranaerophilales bacterium]